MSACAVENAAPATNETAQPTVEAITEAVKQATLGPKDTSEADAAHAASAAQGRRLYIGNLDYSTTDVQLKEFFEGYSIESTSIPTHPRTGRAVGYAFVDLTTKEQAQLAINELTNKEVLKRKVSVQFAREPGSTAPKKEGEEGSATEGGEQQPREQKKGRGVNRGRGGRGRGRGGLKNRNADHSGQSGSEEGKESTPAKAPGQTLPLTEATNTKVESAEGEANAAAGGFKSKKKRGPPENGIPSLTKIMVANLPYELGEDKLKELFAAYQPESAKIALRPIPRYMVRKLQARGEARKGRGFGFVTLSSEEMQKKAVEEMHGKVVDGREIAVKVAIDSQLSESEDKENSGEENADTKASNGVGAEAEAIAA